MHEGMHIYLRPRISFVLKDYTCRRRRYCQLTNTAASACAACGRTEKHESVFSTRNLSVKEFNLAVYRKGQINFFVCCVDETKLQRRKCVARRVGEVGVAYT